MWRRPALLVCLAGLVASPALSAEKLVDGIAAQVGSDIVLVSEVMQLVGPIEAQIRAQGATDLDVARLRADGLEQMIEVRLVEQVVRQAELYATDEEIDSTIRSIAEQNQLSVGELRQSVTSHGLSYEAYRAQIKREIERRKVVGAMLGGRVHVEEDEIRALYAERFAEQPEGGTMVHLRQILVTFGKEVGRDQRTACAQVQEARARIAGGEAFVRVAAEVSEVTPERGGDIGWLHWDTAAAWMKDVVGGLEPGQTSDVLALPSACGLLQLVARREYEPVAYEDIRPALEQELYDRHMEEALSEWMETLRAQTYIERKGYFAAAASFAKPKPANPVARETQQAPDLSLP